MHILKWLTLSLFAYVATVFLVGVPWGAVAENLVLPRFSLAGDYLTVVVAVPVLDFGIGPGEGTLEIVEHGVERNAR